MQITKQSILTQEIHIQEIDVTEEQLAAWRAGANVQDAMPHLTASEREFIMTGITQQEWDLYMSDGDE